MVTKKENNLCADALVLCQQKGWDSGTVGGGWGPLQDDVYMVAARLVCQRSMVGTRWAKSHPDCMNRLRKLYYHLVGGREGCLGAERAVANDNTD